MNEVWEEVSPVTSRVKGTAPGPKAARLTMRVDRSADASKIVS